TTTGGGNKQLVLAYVAPDTATAQTGNSVFVRHYSTSWSVITMVQQSREGPAFSLRLRRQQNGLLNLLWTQTFRAGRPAGLRISRSTDDGVTWSPPETIRAVEPVFLSAVAHPADQLQLFYVTGSQPGRPVRHVSVCGDRQMDRGSPISRASVV